MRLPRANAPRRYEVRRSEQTQKLRELEKGQRVDFICPHCDERLHACTLRDFSGRESTERLLGTQALRAHLPSCPKKLQRIDRQEATDQVPTSTIPPAPPRP